MMSISLIAVPVFLDTTSDAPLLFRQWARTYHYGHMALPTMAVGTLALYGSAALGRKRSSSKRWGALALAGLTTVAILPFTWLVMVPTNNELFRLDATQPPLGLGIAQAKELVTHWAWLHFARSLFPLIGAVMGAFGIRRG